MELHLEFRQLLWMLHGASLEGHFIYGTEMVAKQVNETKQVMSQS